MYLDYSNSNGPAVVFVVYVKFCDCEDTRCCSVIVVILVVTGATDVRG